MVNIPHSILQTTLEKHLILERKPLLSKLHLCAAIAFIHVYLMWIDFQFGSSFFVVVLHCNLILFAWNLIF